MVERQPIFSKKEYLFPSTFLFIMIQNISTLNVHFYNFSSKKITKFDNKDKQLYLSLHG